MSVVTLEPNNRRGYDLMVDGIKVPLVSSIVIESLPNSLTTITVKIIVAKSGNSEVIIKEMKQ